MLIHGSEWAETSGIEVMFVSNSWKSYVELSGWKLCPKHDKTTVYCLTSTLQPEEPKTLTQGTFHPSAITSKCVYERERVCEVYMHT